MHFCILVFLLHQIIFSIGSAWWHKLSWSLPPKILFQGLVGDSTSLWFFGITADHASSKDQTDSEQFSLHQKLGSKSRGVESTVSGCVSAGGGHRGWLTVTHGTGKGDTLLFVHETEQDYGIIDRTSPLECLNHFSDIQQLTMDRNPTSLTTVFPLHCNLCWGIYCVLLSDSIQEFSHDTVDIYEKNCTSARRCSVWYFDWKEAMSYASHHV